MTYSIETVTLKFNNGHRKQVTRITDASGKAITFMEKLTKREAIKNFEYQVARGN